MEKNEIPQDAKSSRFGWAQPARVEEFKKLAATEAQLPTTRVVFQEETKDLSIIRVPIELPKYRLANGRTVSLQAEYLAQNPKVRQDLFSGDPEVWDAQEAQHKLLLDLGDQSDLKTYFENVANKQTDPIVLDENGFVVNGNRRLACWRELLFKEPAKYAHFRFIDIAVLPHSTDKEIDRLEARLQVTKDIKASYSWDSTANMMLAKQQKDGYSNKELGELYDMPETEVQELLDMRSYANEYLRSRGLADRWSKVANDEFAFKRLVSVRSKLTGVGRQELFKESAFVILEKPDSVGRVYEAMKEIGDNIDLISEKLGEVIEVRAEESTDEVDELFGGSKISDAAATEMPLAREVAKPEYADQVREIIVEVLDTQRQLKKDAKAEGYLLKMCSTANANLTAAVKSGLRPESKVDGVEKQLASIEQQVTLIKNYLAKNVKS